MSDDINIDAEQPAQNDDLDNFFAKKDKKGKKKKKKIAYVATEELAKTLEKVSIMAEGDVKEETQKEENKKNIEDKEQNEWHDYEDENDRDYSDLKIQNFQIRALEQQEEIEQQKQYDDAGELIVPKPADGPWKKIDDENTEVNEGIPEPKEPPPKPKEEPAPVTKSSYVPPHLRRAAQGTNSSPSTRTRVMYGRKQEAPKLQSEIDFPTLNAAVNDTETPKGFETVKQGARSSTWEQQQSNKPNSALKLGNQFSALRN